MLELLLGFMLGVALGYTLGLRHDRARGVYRQDVDFDEPRRSRSKPSERCSPHQWKMPEPGDPGLICTACGRLLEWQELADEPYILESIVGSLKRRKGKDHADGFMAAAKRAVDEQSS
ncbi:MAG: hypothetical protein F4W89_18440 [Acidobacteria bacterium]|nr:hypothetical protein [Acidobacteriota bacterium]